jgi:hypothetical protein
LYSEYTSVRFIIHVKLTKISYIWTSFQVQFIQDLFTQGSVYTGSVYPGISLYRICLPRVQFIQNLFTQGSVYTGSVYPGFSLYTICLPRVQFIQDLFTQGSVYTGSVYPEFSLYRICLPRVQFRQVSLYSVYGSVRKLLKRHRTPINKIKFLIYFTSHIHVCTARQINWTQP